MVERQTWQQPDGHDCWVQLWMLCGTFKSNSVDIIQLKTASLLYLVQHTSKIAPIRNKSLLDQDCCYIVPTYIQHQILTRQIIKMQTNFRRRYQLPWAGGVRFVLVYGKCSSKHTSGRSCNKFYMHSDVQARVERWRKIWLSYACTNGVFADVYELYYNFHSPFNLSMALSAEDWSGQSTKA